MGSIVRQSLGERFIAEFNDDLTKVLKVCEPITLQSHLGIDNSWGEVRFYLSLLVNGEESIEVDTGFFVFDCECADLDIVERLMDLLKLDRDQVVARLIRANIFPAEAFESKESQEAQTIEGIIPMSEVGRG